MPALPTGTIVLWYGSIASIPAGFRLCDGAGGSPDLRDRFIAGAGGIYPVGSTAGSATHRHAFTGDGHTHAIVGGALISAGANYASITASSVTTGQTDFGNSLPPYHALAYIMKT